MLEQENLALGAVAGIASHNDKVLLAWHRFARAPAAAVPPVLAGIVEATLRLGP